MATATDHWFVRLPDGRSVRARNLSVVRSYLASGRIPLESRVRRHPEEPWLALHQVPLLADLAPEAAKPRPAESPSQDLGPNDTAQKMRVLTEFKTIGVRGLVEELFNAADSTLSRRKIIVAALAGFGLGLGLCLLQVVLPLVPLAWQLGAQLAAALAMAAIWSLCTAALSQITYIELSRLRPPRPGELGGVLPRLTLRLLAANLLAFGLIAVVLLGVSKLPLLLEATDTLPWYLREPLEGFVGALRVLLEVILWPVLGLSLMLIGPIYAVEDAPVLKGLREWVDMLRKHLGRIFLYEAIALVFALVLMLPLMLPLFVVRETRALTLTENATLWILTGVAATPFIAFLLVANVFVYLNLRYEFYHHGRDRGEAAKAGR